MTAVLETERISVRFGGLQALADVAVAVDEQEIVGIIGPNGAGKTTLFDCICGFRRPDRGSVRFRGADVTGLRPDQRCELGLGRSFQQVGLVRSFTVLENLVAAQHRHVSYSVLGGLVGTPASVAEETVLRERSLTVLDYLGLSRLAHRPVTGLPYGVLKQVEIAAVLATDPQVLMLDEPLAGLAPEEAAELGDRLLRMRRELQVAIVVIEHHVPFVLRVCDYLYVLNSGAVLAQGLPGEIRDDAAVAEAYMGRGATTLDHARHEERP